MFLVLFYSSLYTKRIEKGNRSARARSNQAKQLLFVVALVAISWSAGVETADTAREHSRDLGTVQRPVHGGSEVSVRLRHTGDDIEDTASRESVGDRLVSKGARICVRPELMWWCKKVC